MGCNTDKAFTVPWLTVGVSNGLQMAGNLTGGLSVVYQGHLANLGPFREILTVAHEKRQKGAPEDVGVSECKTDNGEKARMHETNTYANEMRMINMNKKQNERQKPNHESHNLKPEMARVRVQIW